MLAQAAPSASDSAQANQARAARFKESKYRLIIHWGYTRFRLTIREAGLKVEPTKLDAESLDAVGAKRQHEAYRNHSKHHDGFALFDSTVSAYNVVAAATQT
jgi:hypothetical protein